MYTECWFPCELYTASVVNVVFLILQQSYFQLSPGGDFPPPPRIPNSPSRKTPKIQKNIKKCIEFTPQICVSPQNLESRINTEQLAKTRVYPNPQP